MSLTGRSSPSAISTSSPRGHEYPLGTAVASGTNAELGQGNGPSYSLNDVSLYSVCLFGYWS